jgi:hypothetical protein
LTRVTSNEKMNACTFNGDKACKASLDDAYEASFLKKTKMMLTKPVF